MTHTEIRQKFLDFFKARGHVIVPSSSLLPDDPSVLFTTAGMQQFKKYYTNPELAPSPNVASIQKSMRTSDIDEVGDESHLTFFEMLGNFSFGGYFKKEAIEFAHEFITQEMGLKIDYISVYLDDAESEKIWIAIDPFLAVKKMGKKDNWWGPTGDEGPCGPTTEIYVNGIEIWNVVFNEFFQDKSGNLEKLKHPGIDTGMGLERLAMVAQGVSTIFDTDLFDLNAPDLQTYDLRTKRIIADHARAVTALVQEGLVPSNKDRGYVLRRLIRRMVSFGYHMNLDVYREEAQKFSKTLKAGLRELKKTPHLDAPAAFRLYESYGLPFEVMRDVSPELSRAAFDEEFKKHQAKSREGSVKKFGGHGLLLDTGELKAANEEELKKVTRLHTATHMLQAALRKVLGDEVRQAGSDITAERLRFDFTMSRKLTIVEIKDIEKLINDAIAQDLPVTYEELPIEEAKKTGALYFFKEKYPDRVKVYSVGDFSKEFCGGPHVTHTGEIGKFKILKEEAVSTGTRRIRATVL